MIDRFLYFGYYLKELDFKKFSKFLSFAAYSSGKPKINLVTDGFLSSFKYNISLLDYFFFRFYELTPQEREAWAGTGFMYEYHLKTNPKDQRHILENKLLFLEKYREFVIRKIASLTDLEQNKSRVHDFLQSKSGKLVAKNAKGQIGKEVKIIFTSNYNDISLLQYMHSNKLDLLEEFVVQHPDLMALSPSGLNTIRIFTHVQGDKIHYLGARLRITINSEIDNMAAGNPAAPIDMETGIVSGPAVFSDITMNDISVHPVTKTPIVGFQVPYWEQIVKMIERAAFIEPGNKSVGWDIGISIHGPELIEGNHNWCKLLWQLPVKKGLKQSLIDLS